VSNTPQVYGVRETLEELRQIDGKLRLAAMSKMRGASKPLVDAINAYVPNDAPLSGFEHNGRTGWGNTKKSLKFRAKVGGRKAKHRDEWPLVVIRNDSAPVSIFDMAGTGILGAALSGRFGPASRAAWRPEDQLVRDTQAAVLQAIEDASARINQDLVTRPGGVA
jgi:hypothetical protein